MRPVPARLLAEIQRFSPPAVRARRVVTLGVERLHPVVRIARESTVALAIPTRIIFDLSWC